MSREPAEAACELRATSTVRRALSKSPPEAVAAAAYEFITGPLLGPAPDREAAASSDRGQVQRASVVLTGSSTGSTTRLAW